MDRTLRDAIARWRVTMTLLGGLAAIGLLLAPASSH
jgi:hypothetical protein